MIHGESGVGKSWLADTIPAPRVIFDAEGRAKYTPSSPKISWDPRQGPPPSADGSWETCVVNVTDFEVLNVGHQYLRAGQHEFVSGAIDSVMMAQKRCIAAIAGTSAMDQQNWGELLRRMEGLVQSFHDLTLVNNNTMSVVVFVCGSRMRDGKMQPILQGQFQDTFPFILDVVGYYFKQPVQDVNGATSYSRSLLIDQQPGFVAKDNTGRLIPHYGPVIQQPNIAQLVELLHVNGKPEGVTA